MSVSTILRCAGCATTVDPTDIGAPSPYRCPNAERARDVDHVLTWDPVVAGVKQWPASMSTDPFLRYRSLQHSYHLHLALGGTDAHYVRLVERLGVALVRHGGPTFAVAPLRQLHDVALVAEEADVWVRDDTAGVAGSHKARHLMAILLHLEVRKVAKRIPLAIASCGNAALAAATLARAAARPIHVFVPTWANPVVVGWLRDLGAHVVECPRRDDDPPGDPCLHRFREAVSGGALPFTVQGSENGFAIDGGATAGHELADGFAMLGVPDRLLIQVGGGAWASGVWRGLRDARGLGVIDRLPALHCVQAQGCAPLVAAWMTVATRALIILGQENLLDDGSDGFEVAAATLAVTEARRSVEAAMQWALTHRSGVMVPWLNPQSVATGIIDDEAYDWAALVRAMLVSGGWPVTVSDAQVSQATALVNADGIDADETGSAAVAGVLALGGRAGVGGRERAVATVTGIRRHR